MNRKVGSPNTVSCRVREQAILGGATRVSCSENKTIGQNQLLEEIKVVLPWCITAQTRTKIQPLLSTIRKTHRIWLNSNFYASGIL